MTTELRMDDLAGLRVVAQNMREWDRREIYACRWHEDPETIVEDVCAAGMAFWTAWRDGVPVAAIGCVPVTPRVWAPWCFGTDRFRSVALGLTRLARRSIIPAVRNAGGHRLEVRSLAGHDDAQQWLERSFGAEREGVHPKAGKGGETFYTYGLVL